jgi:hypothetical protein
MARSTRLANLVLILMIAAPVSSYAQDGDDAFTDHAARQIACAYPPDPTAMLLYLNKTKQVDLKKGERVDSETCWSLRPSLAIEGVSFTHVCASAEDPLLVELFPRLYYRGPGTSAGTGLRLITDAERPALDEWVTRITERAMVKGDTRLVVGPSSLSEGKSEVSCNSTSFVSD